MTIDRHLPASTKPATAHPNFFSSPHHLSPSFSTWVLRPTRYPIRRSELSEFGDGIRRWSGPQKDAMAQPPLLPASDIPRPPTATRRPLMSSPCQLRAGPPGDPGPVANPPRSPSEVGLVDGTRDAPPKRWEKGFANGAKGRVINFTPSWFSVSPSGRLAARRGGSANDAF